MRVSPRGQATRRTEPTGKLVVLAYHAIADHADDPILRRYSVPPARFARQLDSLAAAGWTFVDADAVIRALVGASEPPRRAALITFDDGYADFLDAALPVLKRRQIPSVVFVVSSQAGAANDWDQEFGATPVALMDAAALRTIAAEGVEIGSHAMRHRSLAGLRRPDLTVEARESATELESLGLRRPRLFSYPYGQSTSEAEAEIRRAGYEAAFTVTPDVLRGGANMYALPRVMVLRGYAPWILRLRLRTLGWRSAWLNRWFDIVGRRG